MTTFFFTYNLGELKKEEAIKVLIAAFLNDQISNIRNEEIKTEISNLFLKNQ